MALLKGAFTTFDLALDALVALGMLVHLSVVRMTPERF